MDAVLPFEQNRPFPFGRMIVMDVVQLRVARAERILEQTVTEPSYPMHLDELVLFHYKSF